MSQPTNYTIADGTGAQVLQAINNQIQSIRDSHSGRTEPANAFIGQLFYNLETNTLNIYNGSNFSPLPFDPLTGQVTGTTFANISLSSLATGDIDLDLTSVRPDPEDANGNPVSAGSLPSSHAVVKFVEEHAGLETDTHGLIDGSEFVGTLTTQTLTNKTLTDPIINGGTLSDVVGFTVAQDTDIGDYKLISKELTTSGDVDVGGNLTVAGTITFGGGAVLESSTSININDKTLSLADSATTQVGVNNSGLLLGDNGASSHLESFLYTNVNGWAASAALVGQGFKVEDNGTVTPVVDSFGSWIGTTIPITKGGTGATTIPSARTALGLGGAATKDVGTGADEVAAGNHTHGSINGVLPANKGGTGTSETATSGSLLVGNGTSYSNKDLLGSGGITIANNADDVTIGLDASALPNITPIGTPANREIIQANVVGGVTSYSWETPVESQDINWDGSTFSGTAATARETIQTTGNLTGTSSAAVEGFSFNVNESRLVSGTTEIDGDEVTLELIYSDGKNQTGSRKVLASINIKAMLANVNIT